MLEKTTIVPALSRAKMLRHLVDRMPVHHDDPDDQKRWFELFRLLNDCYEPLVDDLMLLSAFEIHGKSRLMRKGYVVHEIDGPEDLKKHQKKCPIHVRTVQASKKRGVKVAFKESTVGIATLLSPKYHRHYPFSTSAAAGLAEVRGRRNLVHFHMGYTWKVSRELLALVEHLDRVIPPHERKRITNKKAS